jgi:hypothetical protein
LALHAVEESTHPVDRRRGGLEAGELRAFERGQLPGRDGNVAGLAGEVAPSAAVHVLCGFDEPDGVPHRWHEHVVFRHAERFGQ